MFGNYSTDEMSRTEQISEKAFLKLYSRRLLPLMLRAAFQKRVREGFKLIVGSPVEKSMLHLWEKCFPGSQWIERAGLPRRTMENWYKETLALQADPNSINKLVSFKDSWQKRRFANVFIWDGDWDKHTRNFRKTLRYRFLKDIWENRYDLTKSWRFEELVKRCEQGDPYRSYHKGVYLDTREKVHAFLEIYLTFMLQIRDCGYDPAMADDPVGIALDRNGRILKINKGLHRLAMAQIVGAEKIPVQVRAVHRIWWEKNMPLNRNRSKLDLLPLVFHLSSSTDYA